MKKHWDLWFWNDLLFSTLPNGQPRGVIVRFWVYLNNIGQLTQNCLTVCASWLPGSPTGGLQVVGMSLVVGLLYICIWSMDVFLMKAHRSRTCPSLKQRIGWEWTSSSCHSSSGTRRSFFCYVVFFLCWDCLSLFCSWFVVYNKKK